MGQNCISFNIFSLKKIFYKHANSEQTCTCTLLSTLSSSSSSTGCPSTYYPYLFHFFTFFIAVHLLLLHCSSQSRNMLRPLKKKTNRKTTNPSIPAPRDSFPWNRKCHFIIYPSALNILQSELFLHLHNEIMVILVICHFIRYPLNFFLQENLEDILCYSLQPLSWILYTFQFFSNYFYWFYFCFLHFCSRSLSRTLFSIILWLSSLPFFSLKCYSLFSVHFP